MVEHILVVCIGNICRSPMAEALLREELSVQGKIERLGKWQDRDIVDPFSRPREAYEVALEGIDAGVVSCAAWLRRQRRS